MNEATQWAAILAVFVLTLAAYRRVAPLVPAPARLAASLGPRVGTRADERLLSLFPGRRRWNLAVFVREDCPGCADLLSQLRDWRAEGSPDFDLAVLAAGDRSYATRLTRDLPGASVRPLDGTVPGGWTPHVFPFAVLLSGDGVVRMKTVGGDGRPLLAKMQEPGRTERR